MDPTEIRRALERFVTEHLAAREGYLDAVYDHEEFDEDEDGAVLELAFAGLDGDALNLGFRVAKQLDPDGPGARWCAEDCLEAARTALPEVFAQLAEVRLVRLASREPLEGPDGPAAREVIAVLGRSGGVDLDHWVAVGVRYDAEDRGYRPGQGDTWVVDCRGGQVSAFCLGTRWVTAAWGDRERGYASVADGAVLVRAPGGDWREQRVGGTVVGVRGQAGGAAWCWGLAEQGGFVARSVDGGWERRSVPFGVTALVDGGRGVIVGGHRGALAISDGEGWRELTCPSPASVVDLAWDGSRLAVVTSANEVLLGTLDGLARVAVAEGALHAVGFHGGSLWVGGAFGVVGLRRLGEDGLETVARQMAVLSLSGGDGLLIGGMGAVREPFGDGYRTVEVEAFRALARDTAPTW